MADEDFEMIPVVSSQLAEAGYDAESKKMRIRFTSGALYEYSNVEQSAFDALLSAPSIGSHFSAAVKWNYPYVKL